MLWRWKREVKPSVLPGERFIGAMRLGWQFVRESQRMRNAVVRTAVFFVHSTALLALIPLVATRLGGGAGEYTLLFSCLGVGAIFSATQLPRMRGKWNRDQIAVGGSILHAFATAGVAFAPNTWLAVPAMFAGGMGWIVVANSVTVSAQLALPDWVRARGMSIYQMAIMGGSALGAVDLGPARGVHVRAHEPRARLREHADRPRPHDAGARSRASRTTRPRIRSRSPCPRARSSSTRAR